MMSHSGESAATGEVSHLKSEPADKVVLVGGRVLKAGALQFKRNAADVGWRRLEMISDVRFYSCL